MSPDALKALEELTKALEAGDYNAAPSGGSGGWYTEYETWRIDDGDEPKKDDKYPHKCPKCGGPAFIGFSHVDCKNKCK